MKYPPFLLDCEQKRAATLKAIVEVGQFRGWTIHAAHVRLDHVHVVVEGESKSEKILGDLKAYASRSLNEAGRAPRWTRGGSAKELPSVNARQRAVRYVACEQGEPMALFVREAADRG